MARKKKKRNRPDYKPPQKPKSAEQREAEKAEKSRSKASVAAALKIIDQAMPTHTHTPPPARTGGGLEFDKDWNLWHRPGYAEPRMVAAIDDLPELKRLRDLRAKEQERRVRMDAARKELLAA